ncbi:hypothetical protein CCP2SC5_30001 [Azospirillaceae bacterium]
MSNDSARNRKIERFSDGMKCALTSSEEFIPIIFPFIETRNTNMADEKTTKTISDQTQSNATKSLYEASLKAAKEDHAAAPESSGVNYF